MSRVETSAVVRRKSKALSERFWARVQIGSRDECWNWLGGSNRYGQLRDEAGGGSYRGRKLAAHRVSYKLCLGEIPKGLHVLHRCDNPRCVNPAHLFLGTHQENMADMIAKRRHAHGERQPTRKLGRQEVRVIRWLAAHDDRLQGDLAREFQVSPSTIHNILKRKTWRREK
jgi:hypothetical protein